MVFFVRIAIVAIVLLVVVVVFFVRIDVVAVVLLVVKLRRCKGKIYIFFFTVNVNRVLETQFTSRCHVEKMPTQTQLEHANRASKARFTGPNSSL